MLITGAAAAVTQINILSLTKRKHCMNEHGAGSAADVKMDKVHLFTS